DTRHPDLFRAVYTVDEDAAEYSENVSLGRLTSILLNERRPLLFHDLSEERETLEQPPEPFGNEQKRSRAWLGVPLLVGQDAVGVISIQSYQAGLYDEEDRDLLQRVGNVVAVALENANLTQQQRALSAALADQVAARTVELATLSAVAAELVLQHPLPTLLERALDMIVPLLGVEGGSVRILDPKRDELTLAAHRGIPPEYLETAATFTVAGSPLSVVVNENQPLVIRSDLKRRARPEFTPPFESLLSVPLRIRDRTLGVLTLLGMQAHDFDQQQIDLAQAIGNQIAIAIENAHLFEEQERQIAELRALSDIGHAAGTAHDLPALLRLVHDSLRRFMRLDAFSMVVFDPEHEIITDGISIDEGQEYAYWRNQPPPPDSLTAWVIRNQRLLHFNDLAAEIGQYPELGQHLVGAGKHAVSWLGAPLISRAGAVIGAISIQGYRPAAFDERDEAFLMNVARQVALHAQNVRLLTQRERQIRELDAIGRIGQLVSASFDLEEMLQAVYQTLQAATGAPIFYLLICEPDTHIVTNAMFIELGQPNDLGWVGNPPKAGSLTDWIISQCEPLLFADLAGQIQDAAAQGITPTRFGNRQHARSWAGVPLLAKDGEPIGVLSVQDYEAGLYDQQTLDFLSQVASHVSLGVQKVRLFKERERQLAENARLFAEAQAHAAAAERQAQRMELVNRISLVLSSRLDLQEILDLAAEELVRLFWADHAGIALFDADERSGTIVAEYPDSGLKDSRVSVAGNPISE
ncbi:MAG TPA: GAF domain-containing protein, partial [Roseiflexaceae bacterium]